MGMCNEGLQAAAQSFSDCGRCFAQLQVLMLIKSYKSACRACNNKTPSVRHFVRCFHVGSDQSLLLRGISAPEHARHDNALRRLGPRGP